MDASTIATAANEDHASERHTVVIVGGGAAGIATASSLLRRRPGLDIAIVEPSDTHAYQPGWTLVGAGVFRSEDTVRPMADVMPKGVKWIRVAADGFDPERRVVRLADGRRLGYKVLVVAPGLVLDWDGIDGLASAIGHDGVTSNYRVDLAPYTWRLVQDLKKGIALFTQPAMPIKCAGAPQKALYLSCDYWARHQLIGAVRAEFHTVTPALFGVPQYVPALMEYIVRYKVDLNLESRLVAIDGPARRAIFQAKGADGELHEIVRSYDMLHVCPPQKAPAFVAASDLANSAGWVDVDQTTLRHTRYSDVFALGDVCSAPNAKTAAAARKQAPVVAENLLATLAGAPLRASYDGYGSCPLTVERGKIVLAEFGYGGKLLPSFPKGVIDGTRPSRLAWMLKANGLPFIYWNAMLKGREWMARPKMDATPAKMA
jgi:sulfide:quinone oxidoreductase